MIITGMWLEWLGGLRKEPRIERIFLVIRKGGEVMYIINIIADCGINDMAKRQKCKCEHFLGENIWLIRRIIVLL